MRIFMAFSTGAMMYRILAKSLGVKEMDYQKWQDYLKRLDGKPDKLAEAEEKMSIAQKLVEKNGVFDKFISNRLLDGIDPSYKTQFVNWAWQAVSEENAFDKYVGDFSETSINADDHEVTDFKDHVHSFCEHFRKHPDFRQECQDISKRLTGKEGCIAVQEFIESVNRMNSEWDARKKYMVTQETIDDAWNEIMQPSNKVDVDGNWGTFAAYRIPNWNALMQVGHQTEWCVARKGESGESYYRQYGEPYYLICDSDRHPFALMNPPSCQFKDVKDRPIEIQNGGDVLPSHRRAILFGKAVLDKVAPNSQLYNDFQCFREIDRIRALDEKDRNDRTDYNAVLDEYYGRKEKEENAVEQLKPKEDDNPKVGNPIIDFCNADRYNYYDAGRKWDAMPESEKDETVDFVMNYNGECMVPAFVIEYIAVKYPDKALALLSDKSKMVKDSWKKITVPSLLIYFLKLDSCDFIDKTLSSATNQERFLKKLLDNAENDDDRIILAQFVLKGSKCSKELVQDILGSVDLKNAKLAEYLVDAIDKGIVDESLWGMMESSIEEKYRQFRYGRNIDDIDLSDTIDKMLHSGNCTEEFRKSVFENERQHKYWDSDKKLATILKNDNGEIVDGMYDEIESMTREELEAKGWGSNGWKSAAICNGRCPDGLAEKLAEKVEYGRGYKIEISEQNYGLGMNVYAFLLSDGVLDADAFMKFVKTNPRLVIGYGWQNRHCTDAVKLALVKKIARQNGTLFHFGEDENPLILNEFFRIRISIKRYGEYMAALINGLNVSRETVLFAIENIDPGVSNGNDVIRKSLRASVLTDDDMVEIMKKYKSNSLHFSENNHSWLISALFCRNDCPKKLIDMAFQYHDANHITEYIDHGGNNAEFIRRIADYVDKNKESADERIKYFCRNLARHIYDNDNCPVEFLRDNFQFICRQEMYGRDAIISVAIKRGALDIKTLAQALDEKQMNYSNAVKEILRSENYNDAEKSLLMSKIDLSKLEQGVLMSVVRLSSGKSMFKRLALALNHDNDLVGFEVATNDNFPQEWIAPYISRNYGMTKGYATRFGIDKNVLESKYLRDLITDDNVRLSKQDMQRILSEGEEDAVWMLKKKLRTFAKANNVGVNASLENGIAMRVASDAMDFECKVARIAMRVASES